MPGLESGHGGSLGASRVFTNEGSKKEKRGLKAQANSAGEKAQGGVPFFPLPSRGAPGKGVHLSREEVSAPGPPSAVTTLSEAPTPMGCEESKLLLRMGTPGGSQPCLGGKPGAASPPVHLPTQLRSFSW